MSKSVTFTKAQIKRAVQGAQSAGLRVTGFTINLDGSITVNSGGKPGAAVDTRERDLAPSWDDYQ